MSFGQVFYVYWSTLCRLVNFMSFGQVLYVVWSTLCRLVKFYMSTGQLNVVWSSFMSTGQLPYTISEGRPPLRNTSSEAGAPPSEVRIENNADRKFSKSKFFQVILETTFVHVSCYPDHYEPKIFFSVFKVHTPFDTRFWTRGLPL